MTSGIKQIFFARWRRTLYPLRDWAKENGLTATLEERHKEFNHKACAFALEISGFNKGKDLRLEELTDVSIAEGFSWIHDQTSGPDEEVAYAVTEIAPGENDRTHPRRRRQDVRSRKGVAA